MRTATALAILVVLAGGGITAVAEQVVLDQSFSAATAAQWSFSLSPSAEGQLIVEMGNPDSSADGLVMVSDKVPVDWSLHDGFYYGVSSDPIIDTSHVPWVQVSQGRSQSRYAMPVHAGSGSTYYAQYQSACGTQNTGTNSLRITYEPNTPLDTTGLPELLRITSQPQEQNSVSTTFDAGSGGMLVFDVLQSAADSGGYHSVYLDGVGVMHRIVGSSQVAIPGVCQAIEIGPGSHTLMMRHEDSYWGDNTGVRESALYFVPEPATLSFLALGGLAILKRRKRA